MEAIDFEKARRPFGLLGFKTLPVFGLLQNLLLQLYFLGNVSLFCAQTLLLLTYILRYLIIRKTTNLFNNLKI